MQGHQKRTQEHVRVTKTFKLRTQVRLRSSQGAKGPQGEPKGTQREPSGAQGGPKGFQKVTKKPSKMAPRMGPGSYLDPGTLFFTKK